ncbi:MAG: tail fiber domain-containing protein [Flavobacteriales bacterium]|nr:tail fiber domain-containing protein [Flavobacteriales bacterium]
MSNVGVGVYTLSFNSTGDFNTAMGSHSLFYITTGNYNSGLGEYAGPAAGNGAFINTTAIGYNSTPSASNRITLGTVANNNLTGGYGTWQNLSDARFKRNVSENVPGLAFITRLRPVTYTMDAEGVDRFLGIAQRMDTIPDGEAREQYRARLHEVSNATLTGFLAQEVEQAAKEVGYVFDGVHHPVDEHDHYTFGLRQFHCATGEGCAGVERHSTRTTGTDRGATTHDRGTDRTDRNARNHTSAMNIEWPKAISSAGAQWRFRSSCFGLRTASPRS